MTAAWFVMLIWFLSKEVAAMVKTATPRYGRQQSGALKAVS